MEETRLFSRLIRFENHCSRELLAAMSELPETPGAHAFKLFAHVMESQLIWLTRMAGGSEDGEKWWPKVGLEGCRDLQERTGRAWDNFLSALNSQRLGETVSYRPKGSAVAKAIVRDILVQLFVHAAHIRGQIALALKDQGINPPLPNYLGFSRQAGE